MKVLELQQLQKSFGDNQVLKGIDLYADKGDVISIIGSSGSGKSTMLRCINFFSLCHSILYITFVNLVSIIKLFLLIKITECFTFSI